MQTLPKDIINHILTFLDNGDFKNCFKSSKLLNVKDHNLTSKNNYLKRRYENKSIIELANNGNIEGLEYLLSTSLSKEGENKADPNLRDNDGNTALIYASLYSRTYSSIKIVELLLKYGANLNLQNNEGYTALMVASQFSNSLSSIKTVELLLKNGANPNLQNNKGKTALMMAIKYSNIDSSIETVELLKEYQ